MTENKNKRTENLTLRDIHVGDWVQVWSEHAERYSPPLKIISIHDDGTIYLVTSDDERPTPWEEDIKNVDALEITPELLQGFGFVEDKDNPNTCKLLLEEREWSYPDNYLYAEKCGIGYNFYFKDYKNYDFGDIIEGQPFPLYKDYIHVLQETMYDFFKAYKLEWKGVQS